VTSIGTASQPSAASGEHVAVGRIAGACDRDPVARRKQRQERQHETGRRAGGDDNPPRNDVDAVPFGVVAGDALPQRQIAERHRVAERTGGERRLCRGDRRGWRASGRLADLHVDDPAAGGFEARRGRHHIHDDEGRHAAPCRGLRLPDRG
jgi:hypothetical protein